MNLLLGPAVILKTDKMVKRPFYLHNGISCAVKQAGASTEHTSTGKSVLKYGVFSIFMLIILGKTSAGVVLAPALLLRCQLNIESAPWWLI